MSEQSKKDQLKDAVITVMLDIMQNGRKLYGPDGKEVPGITQQPSAADIQAAMKLLGRDDITDPKAGKDPFAAAMDNVVEARGRSRAQGGKVPPDDIEDP